jgi:putative DNA primase/helicase
MKQTFNLWDKEIKAPVSVEASKIGQEWKSRCPFHDDKTPSLSINPEKDGGVFNCFGCGRKGSLYDPEKDPANKEPWEAKKIVAVYDYQDQAGNLLFQTVRYNPKDFKQRRPDGNGGLIWNLKDIETVLYRLPKILESQEILIVEGEKDADNLALLGFTATTCPMGAGKWRDRYNEVLKGKDLILCPDNDPQGREHMNQIAISLNGTAALRSLKWLDLPGLPPKGDISDWLAKFEDPEEAKERLSIMIENAEPYTPPKQITTESDAIATPTSGLVEKVELSDKEKSELLSKDFSDTENARRFLKFNRNTFLWIEDIQQWWHYDPLRPGWGDGEMAVRLHMKETAGCVNQLALTMPFTDDKQRLEKLKQCIVWKDANGIENSIKMLKDEGFTQSTKFDTNPFLFLCKSGLINLKTRKLETLKPSDYLHKMSPVIFNPEAKCLQWDQFLKDIFLDQEELILFIKKFCGYTMTADTREEKFLILEGPGANGKSTLLEVMAGILGEYAVPVPFATFKDPKWDQGGNAHQADIVQLIGARFIRSVEVKERARLNIERLKSLTGNDEMSARPPHARNYIKFRPVGKIWLAVNHLPKIYDTTSSCWRRLLRIPFLYTVPPDKLIKDYSKKLLLEESAGILNWMLDGCDTWQKEGLEPIPSIVLDATTEYKLESTPVRRFIAEKCEIGKFQVAVNDLYASLVSWWKEEMGEIEPISKIEVGKELNRMQIEDFDIRPIKNIKHYIGLKLIGGPKVEGF